MAFSVIAAWMREVVHLIKVELQGVFRRTEDEGVFGSDLEPFDNSPAGTFSSEKDGENHNFKPGFVDLEIENEFFLGHCAHNWPDLRMFGTRWGFLIKARQPTSLLMTIQRDRL
jgi:hypothetical protein